MNLQTDQLLRGSLEFANALCWISKVANYIVRRLMSNMQSLKLVASNVAMALISSLTPQVHACTYAREIEIN